MSQKLSLFKFIIQSIILGLAIGFLIVFFKPGLLNKKLQQNTPQSQSAPTSYADAVNKISPSVVSIYAQTEFVTRADRHAIIKQHLGLSSLIPQTVTQQYLGSGVIMSSDGVIVTNQHVINNATKIIVSLWDGSLLEASILGSDKATDIAVLKIEALNLKPAIFADSDRTQTGDIVMAIGNPYGLSQSVSLGIISAKGRSGLDVSTIENFIQTDAAINEGNSGGALINTNGEVVAISTATFNQNGAQGINFAIPSNATKLITQQILQHGEVLRGWLGIKYFFTPQMLYKARLNNIQKGIVIYQIYKNSPAHLAELLPNDIITHVDEIEITDERQYREMIAQSKPGESLEIRGFSRGKPFAKTVTTVQKKD